jgi:hypothetical protein
MAEKHYWGYRIDNNIPDYFLEELYDGRLRQGWGYEDQDLRNPEIDKQTVRNKRMLQVKKGDILLIPHIPEWDDIALVEATEDWQEGYQFNIDDEYDDYGHIFPAQYIKKFTRNNKLITDNLRSTLKNRSRFWNLDYCGYDVEELLDADETILSKSQDYQCRLESSIDEDIYSNKI